jgi:hypothetical protein
MGQGETISYEELKDSAHQLAKNDPQTYAKIGEALGVTEGAVAKAVTTAGPKFRQLQIRIVELLSDVEVEKATRFHVNSEQSSSAGTDWEDTEKLDSKLDSIKDAVIDYIEEAPEPFVVSLRDFLGEAVSACNDRLNSNN